MKTLQNNFTTQEQSKKLLELGVPADSADFFYDLEANNPPHANQIPWFLDVAYSELSDEFGLRAFFPCWSVGRLMEIFEKCYTDRIEEHIWYNHPGKGGTVVERVMLDFNDKVEKLDFSKLEE